MSELTDDQTAVPWLGWLLRKAQDAVSVFTLRKKAAVAHHRSRPVTRQIGKAARVAVIRISPPVECGGLHMPLSYDFKLFNPSTTGGDTYRRCWSWLPY